MACGFRTITKKRLLGLVVLAAVLFGTTGCTEFAQPAHMADVLGTWEAHVQDHVAQIELQGDGTLRVSHLPRAAMTETPQTLEWDDTIDSAGTWIFFEPEPGPGGEASVSVDLEQSGKTSYDFDLSASSRDLLLYYGDVEAGDHLTFVLVRGPATPPPATMKRADLVGRWSSRGDGELWIKADGSFELQGMPLKLVAVIPAVAPTGATIDLSGTWTFAEEPLPLAPHASVDLAFDDVYGHQPKLYDVLEPALSQVSGGLSLHLSDGASWELRSRASS